MLFLGHSLVIYAYNDIEIQLDKLELDKLCDTLFIYSFR